MLLIPYLTLYRGRLFRGAVSSLLAAIFVATLLNLYSSGRPSAVDTGYNTRVLVMLFYNSACALLAISMGLKNTVRVPGVSNETRFLLTRPISRVAIQFYPIGISVAAMVLLPLLGWVVVVGFLWLMHAQSFTALASAFALGPEPSLLRMIYALQTGRGYMAALAAGLALYGPMAASRWFLLSRSKTVRFLGLAGLLMIFLPMTLIPFMLYRSSIIAWMWLLPLKHDALTYLPSNTAIALHLMFAAVWIGGTFFVLRETEA